MGTKTPVLDSRTSEDIYKQALELARSYCPELAIPDDEMHFNPDDPGMIIFKLFSKRTEFLIAQLNKIPDKHSLAFLDFMGIDLLPARQSRVPLTFYLAEGASGTFVPSSTGVASSEKPDVIFETTQGLSVIPAKFDAVFSLNPWEDKYTDHSGVVSGKEDGFHVFGRNADEKPLEHILYLGDDILFDIKRPPSEMKIRFEGTNLSKEYFSRWCDGNNNPLNPKITFNQDTNKLDITFNDKSHDLQNVQTIKKLSVTGTESFWLLVRPEANKIVKGAKLPKISRISADMTVEGIIPETALFNNTPVDVKAGFYPFGVQPKKGDTLYISSEEAFSKEGAKITLDIELEKQIENIIVNLRWEYWDGGGWKQLKVTDNTEAFTKSNQVIIETCPLILAVDINGQSNRWIRVRILSENAYGSAGKFESKKSETFIEKLSNKLKKSMDEIRDALENKLKPKEDGKSAGPESGEPKKPGDTKRDEPPTFTPPFIQSIKLSYSYREKQLSRVKKYNNFQYKDAMLVHSEEPFELSPEKMPVLFLGFKEKIASTPITLFFALKEALYSVEPIKIKDPDYKKEYNFPDEATGFVWKYFNGISWEEFSVEDETNSFRTLGIVRFLVPQDMKTTFEFERELHWIKVEIKDGKWVSCPKLKGIFTNTVWAQNHITQMDEILGSGNGEPNLTLTFSNKPLLEGEVIEVKEIEVPSKDELKAMESREGREALRIIEESGEIKEVWFRWNEVKNFALSDSLSRHYILDRVNGNIIFGDGARGMIPPKGMNNIIARQYRSGGGTKGDVASGAITSLKKTIPNIERVINHVPSSGGVDYENPENAVHRGAHTIKNMNRAVTKEDFEWLAKEASQYVARARCIIKNGTITIIIVPKYDYDAPLPEASLLGSVGMYIKKQAFFTIHNRISVVGPDYVRINADVKVKPSSLEESTIVSDRIKERLETFLHPLKGGLAGNGWDFGQPILISQMAAVIEDLEGVDYVKKIELEKIKKEKIEEISVTGQILIEPDTLPCPGDISIEIEA